MWKLLHSFKQKSKGLRGEITQCTAGSIVREVLPSTMENRKCLYIDTTVLEN